MQNAKELASVKGVICIFQRPLSETFQIATNFTRASTHGTRPHWDFQHTGESITQHVGNSCKLPMQHYNNRLLLSAWRWTNAPCSYLDNIKFVVLSSI